MTGVGGRSEAPGGTDAALLAAAIAATPTGIVISDPALPDCPIVFANPAFTAITGYGPDEVIGRNCRFLQGRDTDPEAVDRVRRAIAASRPVTVEMVNYRRDGTRFWNELRIAPVFGADERLSHFIGVQHDVTARHRAEEGQKRARRAADRANRTKSDFLATMSHEIRTPMNGMLGTLSLLSETGLSSEQRAYAETALRCGQDLLAIINDILDLSRIEAGMLRLGEAAFSLADTLRAVLDLAAPAAAAKAIGLSVMIDPALPPVLRGDAQRLRQVVLNLVDNAVKFTAIGGVTIRADAAGAVADGTLQLRIAVIDTGIGIPRAVQARLFRRWTQADASIAGRFGGSGLGLTICRRLVKLMRGAITLESEPGHGATFTVTLPLAVAHTSTTIPPEGRILPTPTPMPAATETARGTGQGARILLAEDSRANQIVAAAILRRAGHVVTVVEDGEEAVARAAGGGFDLVLMDVQMPRRTGIEATEAIRALPPPAGRVPIVAMTASDLPEDRDRCLAAGMDGFITKPANAATLLAAVTGTLAASTPAVSTDAPPPSGLIDDGVVAEMEAAVGAVRMPQLIAIFAEETESRLARLGQAIAACDRATIAHLAHGMRSAAGTFGATALTQAARALEQCCAEGNEAALRGAYAPVPGLAVASLAALRARTTSSGQDPTGS
ncbi:ATP-binding protein [Elioraea sp.]|uniref:ATP-binding protein n=1 Tax=Elioraea sp. TaxID=2185103 RepID=UPI0025C23C18|nr:ATP-binding protein [Elioraea sp.]